MCNVCVNVVAMWIKTLLILKHTWWLSLKPFKW